MQPDITKMWYYSERGVAQGPVPFPQLVQLASSGLIFPQETKVWCEGMADWVAAETVEGLFLTNIPVLSPESDYGTLFSIRQSPAPRKVKPVSFTYILAVLIFEGLAMVVGAFMVMGQMLAHVWSEPTMDSLKEASTDTGGMLYIVGFLLFFTGLIHISYVLLQVVYRMWALVPPTLARTTPERAVGLSLIPYFNIYWCFVVYKGWVLDYECYLLEARIDKAPKVSKRTFTTYPMMNLLVQLYHIPILGWIIAPVVFVISSFMYLKILRELCRVINFFALEYRPFNQHP